MSLTILYQDDDLVVVDKTPGLLVHRSLIDRHATEFAMQTVRDQTGRAVYLVHRLDRPTSGALIMAFSPEMARVLAEDFAGGRVGKSYLAVVRGVPPESGLIDHPLSEELDSKSDRQARLDKPAQEARTEFEVLATHEFSVSVDKFPTSRYALVRARPLTGRKHQIRRHLRHLGHPIVGDVRHGSGKHNRFFRETLGVNRLLLASRKLSFLHPRDGRRMQIEAPLSGEFRRLVDELGWSEHA